MLWVTIFGGIALAGVVMLGCFGVWLTHKVADLLSELRQLSTYGGRLADLVSQVRLPDGLAEPPARHQAGSSEPT